MERRMTMHSAEEWINKLELNPLPEEGGMYREIYRSAGIIPETALPEEFGSDRRYCTSIFYLLKHPEFSAFHRLRQDEIWHFYDGAPLAVHIIDTDESYRCLEMGRDINSGQTLQLVLSAGQLFGATVTVENSYSLIGCTVAPGFEFNDFTAPDRKELLALYPKHRDIIEQLTRPD